MVETSIQGNADTVLETVATHLRCVLKMHYTQMDSSRRNRLAMSISRLVPGIDYDTVARIRSFVMDDEYVAAAQGHTDLADSLGVAHGALGTVLAILTS